jgi:hypothetical protein
MPDREEALHGYVTDMLALEEQIQKAGELMCHTRRAWRAGGPAA